MYSLSDYGGMIADGTRVNAYAEALRKTVRPGSVVVEIGTGLGVFAVLASKLGAKRVYAIEPADVIQVGREVAVANGCGEEIEFIQGFSTRVTLPVRADVIVCDLRDVLPFFGNHFAAVADARRRLLAPNGILIPKRDLLWASVVEAPELYSKLVDPWDCNVLGQDLTPARRLAVNTLQRARVSSQQLLAKPLHWATLDYATVETNEPDADIEWVAERSGTGHGILVWFDTELTEGAGFSNAPGLAKTAYGSMFFPWSKPVPLDPGRVIRARLRARLLQGRYLWHWSTWVAPRRGSNEPPAEFKQSQLEGAIISLSKLRRANSNHVAQLSEDGRIQLRALALMDGKRSLEDVARSLVSEFPSSFDRWEAALSYAGWLAQEFG